MEVKKHFENIKPFIPVIIIMILALIYNQILTPFILSAAIAYLLYPTSVFLEKKMNRLLALLIVFICLIGIIAGLAFMVIPMIINEASYFVSNIPEFLENIKKYTYIDFPYRDQLLAKLNSDAATIGNMILKQGSSIIAGGFTFIGYVVTVPIFVFYFLKDREVILGFFKSFVPKSYEKKTRELLKKIDGRTRGFLKGQILDFMVLALVLAIGFSILGLKYALILALLCAVFNLVPYIGMFFSLTLILSIGWFQTLDLMFIIKVGVFFSITQFLETFVLSPNLIGSSAEIHPLAIILGILILGSTFGLVGILFAIPIIIILDVLIINQHLTSSKK